MTSQHFLQFSRAAKPLQFGLGLAGHVAVHQRQRQLRKAAAQAEQGALGLQLSPMQATPVVGDVLRPPSDGLDLLQSAKAWIVAVGAAPHFQRAEESFQRDLAFAILAMTAGLVTSPVLAFQRGGRKRECRSRSPRLAVNSHKARPEATQANEADDEADARCCRLDVSCSRCEGCAMASCTARRGRVAGRSPALSRL